MLPVNPASHQPPSSSQNVAANSTDQRVKVLALGALALTASLVLACQYGLIPLAASSFALPASVLMTGVLLSVCIWKGCLKKQPETQEKSSSTIIPKSDHPTDQPQSPPAADSTKPSIEAGPAALPIKTERSIASSTSEESEHSKGPLDKHPLSLGSHSAASAVPARLTAESILEDLFKAFPELQVSNLQVNELMALGLYWHMTPKQPGETYFYAEQDNVPFSSRDQWIKDSLEYSYDADEAARLYDQFIDPLAIMRELIQRVQRKKIVITTSASEILEIFNRYKVIQLRPLFHDTLVIGCGNGAHHWDEGGENHPHEDADTVNSQMGMNPSVVATWGDPQNNDYFSGRDYSKILDEGPICIFMQERLDDFFLTAKLALRSNGVILLPNHIRTSSESSRILSSQKLSISVRLYENK